MSSTDRAAVLAENLAGRLPTEADRLELSHRAGIPMAELRGMLAGALLPCPRTMGLLAAALHTTPRALFEEPTTDA